jgi:predicted acyltransferase
MMNADVSKRLVSLDIFRGLTIAAMIVVNNQGSGHAAARFAALVHSEWNGCTLADLIFPFFVFIVGVATVYSLGHRAQAGQSLIPVYRHIFFRTLKIFLLGLVAVFAFGWLFQAICPPEETDASIWSIFLSPPADTDAFFYSLGTLRLPGVLQRLALVYLAVALLTLHTRWRTQAMVAGALLLGYWGLMTCTGFSLEAGADLGSTLDRAIFGHAHLYMTNWDPEGLLGTLPAIATGLLGALTGHWLKSSREGRRKLMGLFLFGMIGIAAGRIWGLAFPINKSLWTSSLVLYTAGFALLFLGLLYGLMDLRKVNAFWARPFVWLGHNPLLAYCGSQVGSLAFYHLYLGTPAEHTNLLALLHNALFGVHWDILGETTWRDPRWPSLYWGLACLTFWTLLVGPVQRHMASLKAPLRMAARNRLALLRKVNGWVAEHLAGGYLGG